MRKLKREFYDRETLTVAEELVGKLLVRYYDGNILKCRITETEAYIGAIDKASHCYKRWIQCPQGKAKKEHGRHR